MNKDAKSKLTDAATALFRNLQSDINNATTRFEHVRLTALAQQAENLVIEILNIPEDGSASTSK
jgi:hypothetical protein